MSTGGGTSASGRAAAALRVWMSFDAPAVQRRALTNCSFSQSSLQARRRHCDRQCRRAPAPGAGRRRRLGGGRGVPRLWRRRPRDHHGTYHGGRAGGVPPGRRHARGGAGGAAGGRSHQRRRAGWVALLLPLLCLLSWLCLFSPAPCLSKPARRTCTLFPVLSWLSCAPPAPVPLAGGMPEFRRSLAASFLFKALLHAAQALEGDAPGYASPFPASYRSGEFPSWVPAGLLLSASACFLRWPCLPPSHSVPPTHLTLPRPCLVLSHAAVKPYERPPSHGLQYYSEVPGEDVVGQPYRHMAADEQVRKQGGLGVAAGGTPRWRLGRAGGRRAAGGGGAFQVRLAQPACRPTCLPPLTPCLYGTAAQVSGTALYVDDMKLPSNALHAALVLSTRPHARLLRVETAAAAAMPGVAGVYTAADVPGGNDIGPAIHDEELFATVREAVAQSPGCCYFRCCRLTAGSADASSHLATSLASHPHHSQPLLPLPSPLLAEARHVRGPADCDRGRRQRGGGAGGRQGGGC